MNTVCLLSTTSIIIFSLSTVGPHGPCSCFKGEFSLSFTESIDSSTWHLKIKLHEFISQYQVRAIGVNINNVWLSCTSELETEWVLEHSETSGVQCHVSRVWHASDHIFWNFKSGSILISEFDFSDFIINLTEIIRYVFDVFIVRSNRDKFW